MTLAEIRETHPELDSLSDRELTLKLHELYRPDTDIVTFSKQMGFEGDITKSQLSPLQSIIEGLKMSRKQVMDIYSKPDATFQDFENAKTKNIANRKQELTEKYNTTVNSGKRGVKQVFKEKEGVDYIPFINSLHGASDSLIIEDSAYRAKIGKATPEDLSLLEAYAKYKGIDTTFKGGIADVLTEMPSFVGELAMLAPLGIFKGGATIASKVIPTLANQTIKATLQPTRFTENAVNRMIPELSVNDANELLLGEGEDI
jgi:hypothetical protein